MWYTLEKAVNSHTFHSGLNDCVNITPHDHVRFTELNFHPSHCFGEGAPAGNWRRFEATGMVADANPKTIRFEDGLLYEAMRLVMLGGERWENTRFYHRVAKKISSAHPYWGCQSPQEFLNRLTTVIPHIVHSIAKHGFLTQSEIISLTEASDRSDIEELMHFKRDIYYDITDEKNEIKVGIDPVGRLILLEGQHRMAAARLLQVERIPALVTFRHRSWNDLRRKISEASISRGAGLVFRHPDLVQFCLPEEAALSLAKEMADSGINYPISFTTLPANPPIGSASLTKVLTRSAYLSRTSELGTGHWHNANRRWIYHSAAACLAQVAKPSSPSKVLEMGTMGVNIVPGSDTIDYSVAWQFAGKAPTYMHDARITPWPIADNAYDLFIALRVFHHLAPNQEAAFKEAKRISRHIIIVTPESYDKVKGSRGIFNSEWISWNNGVPPAAIMELDEEFGNLYYWDPKALGRSES